MYPSVDAAFETMLVMANETQCVRPWADDTSREGLDSANNFSVERNDNDEYRVTVESDGVTCVAIKSASGIEVTEGTEEDFMAFCEEFTLAW